MLEHLRADAEIVLAEAERRGGVANMDGDAGDRRDIVEEGLVDIDRRHLATGLGERAGEDAAADADLDHALAGRRVAHRLAEHPVAAGDVEAAAGRVGIAVQAGLEFNVLLLRADRLLLHPSSPMPTVSRTT